MTEHTAAPRPDAPNAATRRRVLGAALWAPPAVTLAAAAPAFASSQTYDLRVQTFQFNEASNWSNATTDGLYGVGYVSWRVRVCNDGPLQAPAGTGLDVGLGMGPYFDGVGLVSGGGLNVNHLGVSQRYEEATMYNDDSYFRSFWKFTINSAIPVGCFDLKFTARLRRQPIDSRNRVQDLSNRSFESKNYNINTIARLTPPNSGDRIGSNNNDTTDNTRGIRVHINTNASTSQVTGTYTALPQSAPTS